jgi:hypothetical protein
MIHSNNGPARGAKSELPAVLTVCMVLGAAILAKSGYPFLAAGGVPGLQVLYPAAFDAAKQVFRF